MEKKQFAFIFTAAFIALTVYIYFNNSYVEQTIVNDGLKGVLFYILSNPAYVLLFFSIMHYNQEIGILKNVIGGFVLVLALDIVSFPRLSQVTFPVDVSSLASSDALLVGKIMSFGVSYSYAWTFYYLVVPIVLIIASLQILGIHNFYQQIVKKQ